MKKLILSASILMLSLGAFAQNRLGGESVRFGIKAGVNLSKYGISTSNTDTEEEFRILKDYQKSNIGFNVTAFGDFGVGNNFFIQPAISLQNMGTKAQVNKDNSSGTFTQNTMFVQIPVNAVLRIPTGDAGAVQLSAGPYMGFAISGKNKYEGSFFGSEASTEETLKFGSSAEKDLSSIDFGANFGVGYRLNNGVLFGANYGLGLSNMLPKESDVRKDGAKLTNQVWGFSVGYSF